MDSFGGNWLVTNLKHSNGNDNTVITATVETASSVKLNESGILKTKSSLISCCSNQNSKHCDQEGAHDSNSWIP